MKFLMMILFTLVVSNAQAARFSAFNQGDTLYVTIIGDNCNSYGGRLQVASSCLEDRMTENYAVSCYATLSVLSTKMFCGPGYKARVLEINLREAKVAQEAKKLTLNYLDEEITIDID